MSYDPKCEELASYFIPTAEFPNRKKLTQELAQEIQDSIEAWLKTPRNEVTAVYCNDPEHAKLAAELKELKAWKESAMAVWPPMQEIGTELGVELGDSIHDKILPAIKEHKRLAAALKSSEVENALLVGRLHTIHLAGEFGGSNYEVAKRLAELENLSYESRQYVQHAQQREHDRNVMAAALASALGQLRERKAIWEQVTRLETFTGEFRREHRQCADSLAPIIALLEGAK